MAAHTPPLVDLLRQLAIDYDLHDHELPGSQAHPLDVFCRRIERLTGIPESDVREAAYRLNTPFGLDPWDKHGMARPGDRKLPVIKHYPDLRHLYGASAELDRNGSTAEMFRWLQDLFPEIVVRMGFSPASPVGESQITETTPEWEFPPGLSGLAGARSQPPNGGGLVKSDPRDTGRRTPKKESKKRHNWNGTAQNCFNEWIKSGRKDALKPFVLSWVLGKKKNGKPIGGHSLYKRFMQNPKRWKPFISGDT